jgi:hypothetical protein
MHLRSVARNSGHYTTEAFVVNRTGMEYDHVIASLFGFTYRMCHR